MTSALHIELNRMSAGKVHPSLDIGDARSINNVHRVRVTSTSSLAGGGISIDTRAIRINRVTSVAWRCVDGNGIIGMPVGRFPVLEDPATGFCVIVALLRIADGGRRFTTDETSIDC